ncbi:hypothetical protein RRG08_031352 [Elysia crispata]|uniref:Uncharacterized protein n=1 Tax=Elysia crispata TaxID=231223 RepID=A0AAE0YIH7_9GAST|nr:hypothetical protein RRG08_031352 [Elysia crispata]
MKVGWDEDQVDAEVNEPPEAAACLEQNPFSAQSPVRALWKPKALATAKIDICRTSRGLLRKYKHGELACFSVEALSRREGQRDVGGRIHVRG